MLSSEILDALDDENRVSEDGRRRDEAADHQKTPLENKSRMSKVNYQGHFPHILRFRTYI